MKPKFNASSFRFQPVITVCCSLLAALGATQSAHAVDYTYTPPATGTGGTVNWSTGTFWGMAPVSGIDTRLFFGGTLDAAAPVVTNNDIATPPFQLNNLTFNASGPATGTAPTYTISGSQLQFISNGAVTPTMTLNAGGTVKPALTISNNLLLTNDLTINATTNGTLSGLISGAGRNLAINGPGTVSLSNTGNTFGGAGNTITVNGGGILRTTTEASFNALGSSAISLVLNGGSYIAAGNNDFGQVFTRSIEFQTGGTNNIQVQAGAASRELYINSTLTGSGGFTNAGTGAELLIIKNDGSSTITGTVTSASQGIYVNADTTRDALGGANLQISGGNFIFGRTSATAVTIADFSRSIAVNANGGLSAGNNYTFTHTGILTGSSTLSINNVTDTQESRAGDPGFNGAGVNSVVVLNGNLSGFSGGLTVSNGKLQFGSSATLPGTFGLLTLANTAGVVADLNGRSVTVGGIATGGATGGNIQGNSTGTANTLTTVTNAAQTYGGVISNGGGVALNFTKLGTATQTLTGINTYTGTTTLSRGGLTVSGSGALSGTSAVTVSGGGTLTLSNAAGALNDTASVTLGVANLGGGNLTATAAETIGQLIVGGGANNVTPTLAITSAGLGTRALGSTLNFNAGSVTFTATPSLTKSIIGPWALVANTDFATDVGGGVVGGLNATVNNVETSWDVSGNDNLRISAGNTLTASRAVNTLRATNGGTLSLGGNGTSFNLSTNAIVNATGSTALTISRTGTATGLVTSPGSELILGGTVQTTISAPVSVANLIYSSTSTAGTLSNAGNAISNVYVNSGTLISTNSGALGASNNVTPGADGTINLLGGTLSFSTAAQTLGSGKAIIVGNGGGGISNALNSATTTELAGDITLNGTLNTAANTQLNRLKLSGTISGSGNIVYSSVSNIGGTTTGSGLILAGNNTFTGGVTHAQSTSQQGVPVLEIGSDTALGTGTFNIGGASLKGGAVQATGAARTIANAITLSSNNGGDMSGSGSRFQGDLDLTFTGPVSITTAIGSVITVTNTALTTFSGAISGTNGLTLVGGQRLALDGTNTYTGVTTVSDGTLLIGTSVGSTASIGSAAALNVTAATATLGGHGFINSSTTLTNSAILSAGTSAGSLEFGSNLNLAAGNTLIELGGTTFTLNGTEQYDRIKMSGLAASSLTLGGTLNVSLINSFALAADQVFGIFQLDGSASRTGIFASLGEGASLGTLGGSQELFITYVADVTDNTISRFGGNDIALYTIPEPSSALLLLGGFGMLLGFRRR